MQNDDRTAGIGQVNGYPGTVEIRWYMPLVFVIGILVTGFVYLVTWLLVYTWLTYADPYSSPDPLANSIITVVLVTLLGMLVALGISPYRNVWGHAFIIRAVWWTGMFIFGPAIFWLAMMLTGMSFT